ncbi:MAG TPA: heme o synthase [Polyangiaceae bacterium]
MRQLTPAIDASIHSAIRPAFGLSSIKAFVELTKPGVTRMVLVTLLCGASIAPGSVNWPRLLLCLFGTGLVVGSANALNMVLERESDAQMERTRRRPIPSGRVSWQAATWFATMIGLGGMLVLSTGVGIVAASLAVASHLVYVLVYTPLKRVTPLALHVGGIPGAMPPVIGWAAMTGAAEPRAWILFAILFFWQLPHFLAISLFRKDEYARAGIAVYPLVEGVARTKQAIVGYSTLLVIVTVAPAWLGLAGLAYLAVTLCFGLGFVVLALLGLRRSAGTAWARSLFFASLPYLVAVYGSLVVAAS